MKDLEENTRYQQGLSKYKEVLGDDEGQKAIEFMKNMCPDLEKYTIEFGYGDIYTRPGLDLKSREIAAVAALTAMGALHQLPTHVNGALNAGCTKTEIEEVIIQMAAYAGFPKAINAMFVAKEAFEKK